MPPPSLPAELPLIVLSVTVTLPTEMPPPSPAELPLIVLSVTVTLPPKMPPPSCRPSCR